MTQKKFKTKPGQVDYTNIRWAPVINCVLKYKGKILLVQRSKDLNLFPGYWNGVSGFLDDKRSLEQKVYDELREEVGIPKIKVKSITLGRIFDQDDKKNKKTWIVHPVLVEVSTDKIKLDWEGQGYQWMTAAEAKRLNLLPGFDLVLKYLNPFLKK